MPPVEILAQLGVAAVFIYLYFDLSRRMDKKDTYIHDLVDKFIAVARENTEAMVSVKLAVDNLTDIVSGGLPAKKKS